MPRGIPNSRNAADNPVISTKPTFDSTEHEVNEEAPRLLKSTGPGKDALAEPLLEIATDRPGDPEKAAMMTFLAEPVTVRIATTTDKNAEQVFEINVNGHLEFFRRGESKTVPRYIVDKLARLKQTGYSQREIINAEGIKDILHDPHTALKYDFSVVRDDNPRGSDWLRHVIAEA